MQRTTLQKWLVGAALITTIAACQNTYKNNAQTDSKNNPSANALTLKRIYQDYEFSSDRIGRIRWLADGSGYTAIEKSAATKTDENVKAQSIGKDIVVYDPETLNRKVLVSAEQLTPEGADKPLSIDNYIWSDDRMQLLIYTNSKKVWRSKSRGDYWLLNLANQSLKQLGGAQVKESSLMFAKFSPDASKVAYVVDNNIYLENLTSTKITQLTNDAENGVINGLFDWVYEEEFGIRDGFRWSPDGKKIAYWQLDTSGSKDFHMINNTDELYPTIVSFPYPKVGETNAAGQTSLSLHELKIDGTTRTVVVIVLGSTGRTADVQTLVSFVEDRFGE